MYCPIMSSNDTTSKLREFWVPTVERCGVILQDGIVVEIRNSSPTPEINFTMLEEDFRGLEEAIEATWHTHPRTSANLSSQDYRMFLERPGWQHYIVSETDVRRYYVQGNKVMNYEEDRI